MKIKLSKSQWESVGQKAGWNPIKVAGNEEKELAFADKVLKIRSLIQDLNGLKTKYASLSGEGPEAFNILVSALSSLQQMEQNSVSKPFKPGEL